MMIWTPFYYRYTYLVCLVESLTITIHRSPEDVNGRGVREGTGRAVPARYGAECRGHERPGEGLRRRSGVVSSVARGTQRGHG